MKKNINNNIKNIIKNHLGDLYEKKQISLRNEVNDLFFKYHLSKSMIARKKKVSRNFVRRWTKSPEQDFTIDRRGWKKGNRRKWTKGDEMKIKTIYNEIKEDPTQFYLGATVIEQEWRRRYPLITPPPLRTIGKILSDLGLSERRRRGRNKGAAKYLCYPEYTIYNILGGRVIEADFIGKKYITGRSEPLNFIGFSAKKEPKIRYFRRVSGQSAEDFIKECKYFFYKFEKPDYLKVDNCLATIGSASGKRNISRTMNFLLKNGVIPIFSVPRKPFSQASIEGNNSVFARKFWKRYNFSRVEEVDKMLECFNISSLKYTGYKQPQRKTKIKEDFIPKIYFIRQVREDKEDRNNAYIDVLNEKVSLPTSYINYYVLSEWNLRDENLYVYFEKEKESKLIKNISFKINPRSRKNYEFYADFSCSLLFCQ